MTINKTLRWVTLIGLFIIPFIPLLVSTSLFFPFISGKGLVFRVIIEIVFACWLILALRDKTYWPKKSYLLYSILALIVVTGLATLFSLNPYRSFWSNYERMMGLVSLLHLLGYFLVLISVLKQKVEWFWLANVALLANWLVNFEAFRQLLGQTAIHQGGVRIDATLGNATYLAVYLLFSIFLAAYLLYRVKINWARILYGLTIIVDLFLLYHTATRGTILGLIVGLAITGAIALFSGVDRQQKKIATVILLGLVVLSGGFWLSRDLAFIKNSPVLSRFASISLAERTTQSRFLIWQMSWQGFQGHPVLGWGPENYSMVFSKYYDPAMWQQEPWFDRSHNVFFDWLIDAGLLGLLAYLSIFAGAIYYLWQKRERFGLIGSFLLIGLLAGYFFQNIFVFDNLISYLYFFALIAFIHFIATEEGEIEKIAVRKDYQNQNNKDSNNEINLQASVGVIIIVITLLGSLYYVNYQPYLVSTNLIKAINPYVSTPEQSLKIFQQIFAANTFGTGEALEQLVSKTLNTISDPKVSNDLKNQFVKLTDEQIKISLTRFDQDARSDQFFGSYLLSTGRTDEGLMLLQKAQELSPKKQQILFTLISGYLQKQEATNALKIAKQAYELDPTYSEARKIYAIVLLMTNQNKLAQEILTPIKDTAEYYTDDRIINIYKQTGNQAEIIRMTALREQATKK